MTNRLGLRTAEEFMADYTPIYKPIYPLLINAKSQQYSAEVGKIDFKRLEAVGDIRAKHITPKDSVLRQVSAKEGSKTFKKYFLANQYVQSSLQDDKGISDVVSQVLDENNKLADDLLLLGEGTSASTMINNGLFWSADANYLLQNSDEIANAPDTQNELYERIMEQLAVARDVSGQKAIIVYGSTALAKLDSLIPSQAVSVKKLVEDGASGEATVFRLPSAVTPSATNGFIIVNLEQVKLHYTVLPSLKSQGVNEEKMHSWHNFLVGSMMVECLVSKAIVRQPLTFEA